MAVNLGFQKPLKELLKTERVGIHIGRNRTCWKHLGRHRGDVRTNPTTHWLGPSGTTKKTSKAPTPQRSGVSSSMPPSPSSWCSAVRSRRTVRRGGDDHSWFGRPQAIKRRQGVSLAKKRLDDYLSVVTRNGEGGIRTHEGVTPTRFRVVRDQPDSATSPHALRRTRSLKADEPGTCSMLQKPTALGCGRLKPQPGSGDQLPGF